MIMSPYKFSWNSCVARIRFCALLLVLAFAGCGGGVDSGGTGAQASSASGPITGFGSVIVSGVHFDDSRASITDADGNTRTRDSLKLGMITFIRGSALVVDSTATRSNATSIVLSSALVGPVDNIDANARTITVLSQTVEVKATTVFDDSLNGGLATLAANDVIEVYALIDASNNHYIATRIERKAGVSAYELRGVVSNLDTRINAFNIGNLRISYAGISPGNTPAALGNGRLLRVKMQVSTGNPVRIATQLQEGAANLADQDEARIEGLITNFVSVRQFSVEGVNIDASQAVLSGNGRGLGVGTRVEIEGVVRSGVLVATKVKSKTDGDIESEGFELDGTITAIDVVNRILVLRGVSVDYSGPVDFRDVTIADLAVGRDVKIKGTLLADGTGLQAVRIKFDH